MQQLKNILSFYVVAAKSGLIKHGESKTNRFAPPVATERL